MAIEIQRIIFVRLDRMRFMSPPELRASRLNSSRYYLNDARATASVDNKTDNQPGRFPAEVPFNQANADNLHPSARG
jgi:hypothetical protein